MFVVMMIRNHLKKPLSIQFAPARQHVTVEPDQSVGVKIAISGTQMPSVDVAENSLVLHCQVDNVASFDTCYPEGREPRWTQFIQGIDRERNATHACFHLRNCLTERMLVHQEPYAENYWIPSGCTLMFQDCGNPGHPEYPALPPVGIAVESREAHLILVENWLPPDDEHRRARTWGLPADVEG